MNGIKTTGYQNLWDADKTCLEENVNDFDKIKHPSLLETFRKLGLQGNFNIIKYNHEKPIVNIIFNAEKLNAFPLRYKWK